MSGHKKIVKICNFPCTETIVCDVLTAQITGSINQVVLGSNLSYTLNTGITATNDSIITYHIDFGTGYTDIGISPLHNFTNQPIGQYEVKIYALTDKGNIIVIAALEYNWDGTTLTSLSNLTINRTYEVIGSSLIRKNCDNVITYHSVDNTQVTPTGEIRVICPSKIDERFDNADLTLASNTLYNHTEILCDVVNASFTGSINGTIAGTTYTLNATGVVLTNDTIINYFVDWGNGLTDLGLIFTYNFNNQPSSKYEIKLYALTSNGQIIFLSAVEINWDGTTLTNITTFPVIINRAYQRIAGRALQNYIGNVINGTPYNANGTAYSSIGTLSLTCPEFRNDYLGVSDATNGFPTTSSVTPLENGSSNRIIGAQLLGAIIVASPAFAGAIDVTVYNQYNVTVAFEYTTTINGAFHRVNIPRGGTWSNTLKRDDYANEGFYSAGRIVFAYGAGLAGTVAAPNEININWTT